MVSSGKSYSSKHFGAISLVNGRSRSWRLRQNSSEDLGTISLVNGRLRLWWAKPGQRSFAVTCGPKKLVQKGARLPQVLPKVIFPEKSYSYGNSGTISYVSNISFFDGYVPVFFPGLWLQKNTRQLFN